MDRKCYTFIFYECLKKRVSYNKSPIFAYFLDLWILRRIYIPELFTGPIWFEISMKVAFRTSIFFFFKKEVISTVCVRSETTGPHLHPAPSLPHRLIAYLASPASRKAFYFCLPGSFDFIFPFLLQPKIPGANDSESDFDSWLDWTFLFFRGMTLPVERAPALLWLTTAGVQWTAVVHSSQRARRTRLPVWYSSWINIRIMAVFEKRAANRKIAVYRK